MRTLMVHVQVNTLKIQVGVQVSRPGELRRHLQLWKRFGRFICIVYVPDRNIELGEEEKRMRLHSFLAVDHFYLNFKPLDLLDEVFAPMGGCHVCKMMWKLVNTRWSELEETGKGFGEVGFVSGFGGKRS
ncbi:hypothetical protein Tco_0530712 [Tanacetum coccineum]